MRRRDLLAGSAAASAAGCSPYVQRLGEPGRDFPGPRLETDALVSFDGAHLPMRVWRPAGAPWAVLVALHGMNDHSMAFHLAGPWWAERGVLTYAYDQRGFGRAGQRGVWGGEAAMADDLRTACALVRARHPGAVLGVIGESMGGAVAVAASTTPGRPAPDLDRLILSSPAVWGWGGQPPPQALMLWTMAHTLPGYRLVTPAWLARKYHATDNIEELRRMGRDRDMIFETRVDATYGLMNLMQTARARIGFTPHPERTLMLYGAHDDLVPKPSAFVAAERLRRAGGRTAYYPDGFHLLTRDLHRERVLADVLSFLRDPAAPLPSAPAAIPPRSSLRRG